MRFLHRDVSDKPDGVDTLQMNITYLCNQACLHCHVDASPKRTEMMDEATMSACLRLAAEAPGLHTIDITGGAPELHPRFEWLVDEAQRLGKHVIVRHNLTVTIDGHPNGDSRRHLPDFFASRNVEIVSSLPYYQAYFTDKQRGRSVFDKSIESLQRLNAVGYGTTHVLNLMYNPVGAFLPAPQATLEADFKRELSKAHGIVFNHLYVLTNMPIQRFRQQLMRNGTLDEYMQKLEGAFNPQAAAGIMCRNLVSVRYDGRLYDCDFNQMLDMPADVPTVHEACLDDLLSRRIRFDDHCYGCTAGAGSSCGGSLAT